MDKMEDGNIRWLGDVQRLALKPDDIIVLTAEGHISSEVAKRIKEYAEQALPGRKILVLSGGMKIGVLSPENTASERQVKAATHSAVQRAIRSAS